jgi:uncharacterized protein with WD repeat
VHGTPSHVNEKHAKSRGALLREEKIAQRRAYVFRKERSREGESGRGMGERKYETQRRAAGEEAQEQSLAIDERGVREKSVNFFSHKEGIDWLKH